MMLSDLRFALRLLRRNPGFTIVSVLTIALGLGVNVAIFSLADGMLFRPLPYRDPDRLVLIQGFDPKSSQAYSRVLRGLRADPRPPSRDRRHRSCSEPAPVYVDGYGRN